MMENKEKLQEYQKRMCPPAVIVSNLQVSKARERHLMKDILSLAEEIDFFHRLKKGEIGNKILTPSLGEARLNSCMKKLEILKQDLKSLDSEKSLSDTCISSDLVKYYKASLKASHAGDCNGLPCSCDRCDAESFFKLPYSVNWTQSEGKEMVTALVEAGMWEPCDIEEMMKEEI